jgi:hypothetical protein
MKSMLPAVIFVVALTIAAFVFFRPSHEALTYNKDIAPIFKKNCTPCHYPNGPGGGSFTNYKEIVKYASVIRTVISNGYMPPYHVDLSYRDFPNVKKLSAGEIQKITAWADNGFVEGPETLEKVQEEEAPNKPELTPDFRFKVPEPICVSGDSHDNYMYYPFFLNNSDTLNIRNFELKVQNKQIVHHAWIFIVPKAALFHYFPQWRNNPKPEIRSSSGTALDSTEMTGYLLYTPGYSNTLFVPGICKKIPPNAAIVMEIHYFNKRGKMECDQSVLNIYKDTDITHRTLNFAVLDEDLLTEQPFQIPADSVKSFLMISTPIDEDVSLIKIAPHMHYRGKNVKVFAVTPGNDTLHLIKIDSWDFNWQGIYAFSPLVKLPKGSRIIAQSTFDNTANNPFNPVIPPMNVNRGYHSIDEMFQIAIEYVHYQPGDENLRPQ